MSEPDLAAVIGRAIETGRAGAVEPIVFRSTDPAHISAQLRSLCADLLGADVTGMHFYGSSVGCVAGLELGGGADVVVKAHQPRLTSEFLSRAVAVQRHLAASGFPCPWPLAGPAPFNDGQVIIESLLADPGHRPLDEGSLTAIAAGLARQIEGARAFDWSQAPPHPMDPARGALYPEPHSPVFDFDATSAGAEWIDELATRASRHREGPGGQKVVAHCDWARRNVRLGRHDIVAVYDWDSLAWVEETTAVGQAAVTWNDAAGDEPAPGLDEIAEFVSAYETAAGTTFGDDELAAIGASALYLLAYAARCEHAIDPEGLRLHRSRSSLRRDGDGLLDLARHVR